MPSGAVEIIHGAHFGYMDYLLPHLPALRALEATATVLLATLALGALVDASGLGAMSATGLFTTAPCALTVA